MKFSKIAIISTGAILLSCSNDEEGPAAIPDQVPDFEEAVFSAPTDIGNPFYGPDAGQIYVYEGGEAGMPPEEEIRIERRAETRTVMGIDCIIHHDIVFKDAILIEDTDDWLAEDDSGNLWYFGEAVKNYDDEGNFQDDEGSWEAGVDGAVPGYWFPANPEVGDTYYQEFLEGEAEDQAEVLEVGVTVTIAMGTYEDCIVTKDYTLLEPGVYEKKYYAPGIGFIKEEKFEDDALIETLELVEIIE